jgi:UPF0755 protein
MQHARLQVPNPRRSHRRRQAVLHALLHGPAPHNHRKEHDMSAKTKTKTKATPADRIDAERLARAENAAGSQGWAGIDRQGSPSERLARLREVIGANMLVSASTLDQVEDALRAAGLDLDEHGTPRQRAEIETRRAAEAAAQEQARADAVAKAEKAAAAAEKEREAAAHVQAQAVLAAQRERDVEQLEQAAAQAADEAKVFADRLKAAKVELAAARKAARA